MATQRDMVSRVRGLEKLISSDATITDRVILKELRSKALYFIKQQLDKRKLWVTATIFTNIPCLQMIEVPTSDCCAYVSDQTISRSKFQLPKIAEGAYRLAVQGVFSVDNGMKIKEISLSSYINTLRLGLPTKETYYWFYNRYLYVSSPYVKLVNIWALFEEEIQDHFLYPDCPCPNQKVKNPCLNPLDEEFICPGFLENAVVEATVKILLETYFRIQTDQTSDNKDDQVNKQ